MTSRSMSSRPPAPNSNVRRNLFNHLSRRPTASSSASATTMPEVPHDDSADIVGRDQNGRLKVQMPVLPALEDEKAQAQGEGGGDAGADGVSKDKLEARLIEMYRNHTLQPGEPAELLSAVQASLRRKVASLDADNWMFETEDESKT